MGQWNTRSSKSSIFIHLAATESCESVPFSFFPTLSDFIARREHSSRDSLSIQKHNPPPFLFTQPCSISCLTLAPSLSISVYFFFIFIPKNAPDCIFVTSYPLLFRVIPRTLTAFLGHILSGLNASSNIPFNTSPLRTPSKPLHF